MMRWILFVALAVCKQFVFAQSSPKDKQNLYAFNQLFGLDFPNLELEDTSGKIISTASFKGKTMYVDFWFTACPPCTRQIPYAHALQQFFAPDTNVVFVNICIENVERKTAWRELINKHKIGGIHLFYARNRPQKVNLLRTYKVNDFPTYMLVSNEMKIIGHNAPAPSERYWVQWAIQQATYNVPLSEAYLKTKTSSFQHFLSENQKRIDSLQCVQ